MAISFKDVGVKKESIESDVLRKNRSQIPIGIKTPLQFDSDKRNMFVMHYNVKDQIKDNLKNLLLTNHGERVSQYYFGANLFPLSSEYGVKDDFDSEAMLRINTAITKFMPFVTPLDYESMIDREKNQYIGRIQILMSYSVPALGIKRDQIELEITVM